MAKLQEKGKPRSRIFSTCRKILELLIDNMLK